MEYDVALSFAGEDRKYVEAVAVELKNAGVRVFYDNFEIANLWGKDLYTHLQDVYQNQAKYTVIFISKHYAKKLWTNHERKMAQARAFKESREYILPARFDDTEIEGIPDTTGYIDLRNLSPEAFCNLICIKLDKPLTKKHEPIDPYRLKGIVLANQYQLEEYIGGGGSGAVYRAIHKTTNQIFAIKILKPDIFNRNPFYVPMFEQEVVAAQKISHPNVVKIFDYNVQDDIYFIVMELLEGQTLDVKMANENIEIGFVKNAFRQICNALIAAHSRNIVHLDIKPSNIFILSRPQHGTFVKVFDFGIAKILLDENGIEVEIFAGTPQYCSPEHFGGKLTKQTDIYGLGGLLYNMLTGESPSTTEAIYAKMSPNIESPPLTSITKYRPELPKDLDFVIQKALSKTPLERQKSVKQLFEEFEQAF